MSQPEAPETPVSHGPLHFGPIQVDPPVVLAPMAGVTDAPFRVLCATHGGGLFVNQMVTARALIEGNRATWELARFDDAEPTRSLQLYGTNATDMAEATRILVGEDLVDHLDLNFGCPAPKVTRQGGGAALPVKRRLLAEVISAVVEAADVTSGRSGRHDGVPVTVKFRMGIDEDHLTYLDTGRIAEEVGAAAVALHARTALDHYGPPARWAAIAELKAQVTTIPVLGNGDIRTAGDAVAMMSNTDCDGVVVGRGCLGRPWLFAELEAALRGEEPPSAPNLGELAEVIRHHVDLLVRWQRSTGDGTVRLASFRKHLAWYFKGYPVGSEVRRLSGQVNTAEDVERILVGLDPSAPAPEGAEAFNRSHAGRLRRVALPHGWLDDPDEEIDPSRPGVMDGADLVVSGG